MGRGKVKHDHDPIISIHITQSAYEFIQQQRYQRTHEPIYKTVNRILNKYQEIADQLSWLKEAEVIAREERNKAEQQLMDLRRQIQCAK